MTRTIAHDYTDDGRSYRRDTIDILPGTATVTGAGQSPATDVGTFAWLRLNVIVTAVSGTATPTLTVTMEGREDTADTWHTMGAFAPITAVTAVGQERQTWSGPMRPLVRATWTVTGTNPSFTFSVVGDAG